mgnify:CR=1 FL=1
MYFSKFPVIFYDSVGNFDFKVVTNLLRRVALRTKLREDTLIFDTYDVKDGETPEILAHRLYGDSELHWVILSVNNITDRYHQWPKPYIQHLNWREEFAASYLEKLSSLITPTPGRNLGNIYCVVLQLFSYIFLLIQEAVDLYNLSKPRIFLSYSLCKSYLSQICY